LRGHTDLESHHYYYCDKPIHNNAFSNVALFPRDGVVKLKKKLCDERRRARLGKKNEDRENDSNSPLPALNPGL
jgi:hypothetical protein